MLNRKSELINYSYRNNIYMYALCIVTNGNKKKKKYNIESKE